MSHPNLERADVPVVAPDSEDADDSVVPADVPVTGKVFLEQLEAYSWTPEKLAEAVKTTIADIRTLVGDNLNDVLLTTAQCSYVVNALRDSTSHRVTGGMDQGRHYYKVNPVAVMAASAYLLANATANRQEGREGEVSEGGQASDAWGGT